LKLALEQRGILVRHYDKPGLQNCIRISVGRPEQTDRLLDELRRL
jgi:histidinol-phosphate aminotransferase